MPDDPVLPPEPSPVDGGLVHAALAGTVATLTALTDGTGQATAQRVPQVLPAVTDLDLERPEQTELLVAAAIAVTSQLHDLMFHLELLDPSVPTWESETEQLVACGLEGVHHVLVHHAGEVADYVGETPASTLERLSSVLAPVIGQLARLPEADRRPLLQLVGARADLTARLTLLDRTLDELMTDDGQAPTPPAQRPDLGVADGAIVLLEWLHEHQAHQRDPDPETLPSTDEVAAAAAAAAAITTAVMEYFDLPVEDTFGALVPFASTSLLIRTFWSAGGAWVDVFAHELASEAPYAVAEDAIETLCTLTRLLAEADPEDAQRTSDQLRACLAVLSVLDHQVLLDDLETVVDRVLADPSVLRAALRADPTKVQGIVQDAYERGRRLSVDPSRDAGTSVTTTTDGVSITDSSGQRVELTDPVEVAMVIKQLAAWAARR